MKNSKRKRKPSRITFIYVSLQLFISKYPLKVTFTPGESVQSIKAIDEATFTGPGLCLPGERGSFVFTHKLQSVHKPKGKHSYKRRIFVCLCFIHLPYCYNSSKGAIQASRGLIPVFFFSKILWNFLSPAHSTSLKPSLGLLFMVI